MKKLKHIMFIRSLYERLPYYYGEIPNMEVKYNKRLMNKEFKRVMIKGYIKNIISDGANMADIIMLYI